LTWSSATQILKPASGLGDVNQNGVLAGDGTGEPSIDDVAAFLAGWGSSGLLGPFEQYTNGDLNFDGRTSLVDAFLMHDALQAAGIPVRLDQLVQGASVPVPSTLALLAFGYLLAANRRGRGMAG